MPYAFSELYIKCNVTSVALGYLPPKRRKISPNVHNMLACIYIWWLQVVKNVIHVSQIFAMDVTLCVCLHDVVN